MSSGLTDVFSGSNNKETFFTVANVQLTLNLIPVVTGAFEGQNAVGSFSTVSYFFLRTPSSGVRSLAAYGHFTLTNVSSPTSPTGIAPRKWRSRSTRSSQYYNDVERGFKLSECV